MFVFSIQRFLIFRTWEPIRKIAGMIRFDNLHILFIISSGLVELGSIHSAQLSSHFDRSGPISFQQSAPITTFWAICSDKTVKGKNNT